MSRRSPSTANLARSEVSSIEVRGAAEHNLKKVDLDIPKRSLTVFTGPSGSGKSSLAFDTIYAEGQRRYIESLSAYARQFLGQLEKPKYESIRGLSPTIAIEQKAASRNPRSTVGTITEIHDYLRVLWARIGTQHCPGCDDPVGRRSADEIVAAILRLGEGTRLMLLAPKVTGRKGEYQDLFEKAKRQGFTRVRVDGTQWELDQEIKLDKKLKHSVEVIVDRLVLKGDLRRRVADSVELALREGDGRCLVAPMPKEGEKTAFEEIFFSEHLYCPRCDRSFKALEPNSFSFNSPLGSCSECHGLGTAAEIDLTKVIPDPSMSIGDGAIAPWGVVGDETKQGWASEYRRSVLKQHRIPTNIPWKKLSDEQRHLVLYGNPKAVKVNWSTKNGEGYFDSVFDGVVNWLRRTLKETSDENRRTELLKYFSDRLCTHCQGRRLNPQSAAVRLGGKTLPAVCSLTIREAWDFFGSMKLDKTQTQIAEGVLREVRSRLGFLLNVGLEYLTLDRAGPTLSGGEAQRIHLASQIGSELTGVLYVLDEPSIGLHQRDNCRLIESLTHLRDIGNTVLVVEHDEETIRAADFLVDFGPGAGELGGQVVYAGDVAGIEDCEGSITGAYISGRRCIPLPSSRRRGLGEHLTIKGAKANNLQNLTVEIPLGTFTCITGVSGAGKSSLLNHILSPALANHFNGASQEVGEHEAITGLEHLDKVITIDQQPIGRTPRSNPATYTKAWDEIREIFSQTKEAKQSGYNPGRFSFNLKGGRCEACEGDGLVKVEMHFLSDIYVPCQVCHGKRFNESTLSVLYKGKSIADVLDMSVREAIHHFEVHKQLVRILQTMMDVGLDYIRLGQAATTLSGGEAQRIKLSRELAKRSTGRTLYILDEPSTGLHFDDVRKLLEVLTRLVEAGNTVIVIEHNLDIIASADHIIDLGPEGGRGGGKLIASGTPEAVAKNAKSFTGQYLAKLLAARRKKIP